MFWMDLLLLDCALVFWYWFSVVWVSCCLGFPGFGVFFCWFDGACFAGCGLVV